MNRAVFISSVAIAVGLSAGCAGDSGPDFSAGTGPADPTDSIGGVTVTEPDSTTTSSAAEPDSTTTSSAAEPEAAAQAPDAEPTGWGPGLQFRVVAQDAFPAELQNPFGEGGNFGEVEPYCNETNSDPKTRRAWAWEQEAMLGTYRLQVNAGECSRPWTVVVEQCPNPSDCSEPEVIYEQSGQGYADLNLVYDGETIASE